MKTINRILSLTALLLGASILLLAQEDGVRSKSFTVNKGGTLEVTTSVGDISIST
jgi:hypothetical protein